jgi:hypothetical protein
MLAGSSSDYRAWMESLFQSATPALVSGAIQAVLFNPFDRALYLRTHNRRRRFLHRKNFEKPFQGFGNAAAYRTIVGATYVFWQDSNRKFLSSFAPWLALESHPVLYPVTIGLMTGTLNGITLNNLQAIKFRMWSESGDNPPGFIKTAQGMYRTGGVKVFFRGLLITVQRDAVYGVIYESLRHSKWLANGLERGTASFYRLRDDSAPGKTQRHTTDMRLDKSVPHDVQLAALILNFFASWLATVASSPFNYLRSLAYGAPSNAVPLKMRHLGWSLITQARYVYHHGESFSRIAYQDHPDLKSDGRRHPLQTARWINGKLNIGWGSVRVGLGMAIGQYVFAFVQAAMT